MAQIESFESGTLANYTGSTGSFSVVTTQAYDGTYSLSSDVSAFVSITSDGTHTPIEEGDTFRWYTYQATNAAMMFMWCVQDSAAQNSYWVDYAERDDDLRLGYWDGGAATYNSTIVGGYSGQWLYIEVTHGVGGDLTATLYDAADTQLATVSFTDGRATPYTTGTIGWGRYGNSGSISYADNLYTVGTATVADVTGTVTVDGTPLEGATITGINDTTGEVQGVTTTDINGDYSLSFPIGDTAHLLMEYDDGAGTQYNDKSKPFVVVEDTTV